MTDRAFRYLAAGQTDALHACLMAWQAETPACAVLALVPENDTGWIPLLQTECTQLGLKLAGAVFPALIHANGFARDGVWLCRLAPAPGLELVPDIGRDAESDADRIARAVTPYLGDVRRTLLMLFDAMTPNIASLLDALYLRLGDAVGYLGGNAGSETFQPMACLFDNTQRTGGGVLCLVLPEAIDTVLAHGYRAPDTVSTATATTGNRIASIDWQPAFEVYRAKVKASYGVELDRDNFYQYGVHFPFGIQLASGETLVRIPVGLDEDGALHCVGEVPEASLLTLLHAPEPGTTDAVAKVAEDMGASDAARQLLFFYCAGRRLHLGDAAEREIADLALATGAELAGALTLGEIGGLAGWSYPLFHNGTLVCARWTQ